MAGYLVEELTGRIKGGVLSVPLGISATGSAIYIIFKHVIYLKDVI